MRTSHAPAFSVRKWIVVLVFRQIGRRVEQSDFLHQSRLGVAEALIFQSLIQRRRAHLHVLGLCVLEHTLEEGDTSDVIACRLGDAIGSSAIISITIDEIDETTSARRASRNAISKETSTG